MLNIIDNVTPEILIPHELLTFCEMTKSEREFTAKAVAFAKPKKILEVGVSAGGSTVVLLEAIKSMPETRICSIDVRERWWQNSEMPVGWMVNVMYPNGNSQLQLHTGKDPSELLPSMNEKFDFLLLDTAHIHPAETLNFLTVLPYLTEDAFVVLHDIGLFSRTNSEISNASKLLFDTVTAEKCELFNYEYQLSEHSNDSVIHFPNIAAFRLNADTRKYIRDVFSMLRFSWGMMPMRLSNIYAVLESNYDEECMFMFKTSVAVNLSYLYCARSYNFSSIGNIFCFLLDNYVKILFKFKEYSRIVQHGAGKFGVYFLGLVNGLGFRPPDLIWDKNYDQIKEVDGMAVTPPDYSILNESDLVIIAVADVTSAHSLLANRFYCPCKNIYTFKEFCSNFS